MKHKKTECIKIEKGAIFIMADRSGLSAWHCPMCKIDFQFGSRDTDKAYCSGW